MILYLIKSGACLAAFLIFYKLLLEKERMHIFKRYYLLTALIIAFVIPSITFVEYIEVPPSPISYKTPAYIPTETTASLALEEPPVFNWSSALWLIYALGVLFFLLRFLKNLLGIARNIRNNPKLRIDKLINVLLQNATVPHTFFNYIFLDRKKFEANAIPNEVLVHEAAHAKQKHSLDILFVELLQIVFWFNPLVFITKHAIKLNHEFLADQAVLNHGTNTPQYQNILLAFASSADHKDSQPSMVNAINYSSYSSIKKRFTVMKNQTSKKSVLFRSILLLPLLTLLIMGFSKTRTVEINKKDLVVNEQIYSMDLIEISVNEKGQLLVGDELVALEELASYLLQFNTDLSKEERETKVRVKIMPNHNTSKTMVSDIEDILVEYGVAQIDIVGPETALFPEIQNGATQKQLSKYNTLAKKYNAQPKEKRVIPSGDLKSLENIYRKMSEQQKNEAQPFPECPDSKSTQQEGATEKQVAEYNALAKHYNAMLENNEHIRIKKSDVDRLEYLHGIMTKEQRANAESFPDFPEPPEPPLPPNPPVPEEMEIEEIIEIEPNIGMEEEIEMNEVAKEEIDEIIEIEKTAIREIVENQEIYDELSMDKKITHQAIGNNEIIEIKPVKSTVPHSLSSPNRMESKNAGVWTVSSGANRDSRNVQDSAPIPPVAPTIATLANTDSYSKKLKNSIHAYLEANKSYEKAISDYREKRKGNSQNLWNLYNAAMEKYVAYHLLAKEEGNFVQPVPAFKERIKIEKDLPPAYPAPPKPKAPLEYVIEMAKKNARFYYEGKEITSDKAIEMLKKNDEINIESKGEKGKRPVVKLSAESN